MDTNINLKQILFNLSRSMADTDVHAIPNRVQYITKENHNLIW